MRQRSSSALSRMNNKFADTDVDNVTESNKKRNGFGMFNSTKGAAMNSVLEETPEFTRHRMSRKRFMDDAAVLDDIKV